ncbi:DUF4124 domain-containing protein [Oxalicibacterium flavum]|nr:DUF4124 domain-containing protein [Oxalicibacterium flavum]
MRPVSLTIFFVLLVPAAYAQDIYKCVHQGRTIYSEKACAADDAQNERFEVRDDRVGNVAPDRETIRATRARVQAEMAASANAVSGTKSIGAMVGEQAKPSDRKPRCDALERDIADIEAEARQQITARRQDRLAQKKRKLRQQQHALKC